MNIGDKYTKEDAVALLKTIFKREPLYIDMRERNIIGVMVKEVEDAPFLEPCEDCAIEVDTRDAAGRRCLSCYNKRRRNKMISDSKLLVKV